MEEQLLTYEQVANLLNVHPNTVRNIVKQGRLDRVKIGSATRFRVEDVRQFAESCIVGKAGG